MCSYRLTMRSGVSPMNDNIIGDFFDAKTAHLIAELLWALDRCEHPEYKGYDVTPNPSPATSALSG